MPGTELQKTGAIKSSNPFKAWKEMRDAKKQALAEQAAMEITNDIAENENKIVSVLEGVDFQHSRLPQDVLDKKLNENHPCGELQYATKAMIRTITKNPLDVQFDIREIDKKILQLANIFSEAVSNGEVNTVFASKKALVRGIKNIRTGVPRNNPELGEIYVVENTKHLDSWLNICSYARIVDQMADNIINDKEKLEDAQSYYDSKNAAFVEEVKGNPDNALAFAKITENTSLETRSDWSDLEREIHLKMVENRMDGVQLELKRTKLTKDELAQASALSKLDILSTKVQNLPIVTDPNLMNKFQEEIDDLIEEFARADIELDETLKAIDDIDGRIRQLDSAPGAVRAREIAAEEAGKIVEIMKKQQDDEVGKNKKSAEDALRRLGIRSVEEQEEMKKEFEAQQAAEIEAIMNEETESSLNYN